MKNYDRPSRHGSILGAALAQLAEAGRRASGAPAEGMCSTCAFRPGTMPNQMASTGLTAFKCTIGADPDPFGCHHGLAEDGQPTKLCAGFLAARQAPWEVVKEVVARLSASIESTTDADSIRAEFDAWVQTIDPNGTLDAYQLARAYQRRAS